jgi:hypothetical protein
MTQLVASPLWLRAPKHSEMHFNMRWMLYSLANFMCS